MALQHAPGGAPGALIAKRYRLGRLVAATSLTEIWAACDEVLDRPVTWKLIHAGDVPTAAGRLTIDGVPDLFDVTTHQNMAVVVSEHVDVWPLDRLLEAHPVLHPDDVVTIADATARILDDAHRHGVPHLALRPSNILVLDDGDIRLTDFRGRCDGDGPGPFDHQPDLVAIGDLVAGLLGRCPAASLPPHLRRLGDLLDAGPPESLLTLRLALHPPTATGSTRRIFRWLVPVLGAALLIGVVVASARLLLGDTDPSPDPVRSAPAAAEGGG